MFSPCNTHINFPTFSNLVFLVNHAIITSLIIKLHFVTLSPHNIYITFPKFSLFFLANYAISTSITIKLHFGTLPPRNSHICVSKNFTGFFGQFYNPYIWVLKFPLLYSPIIEYMYIYMFSKFKIHLYVNIACVMFDMWFWHNTNATITF
jgi:hypothetical protein